MSNLVIEAYLIGFLLRHESDIAHGINDYGDLLELFWDKVGRKPRKKPDDES
jgi:hypothetical protein